ncbi:hypothetical protein OF83DRAFT_1296311 [Amylostereum chailletii]|nr:hypothetical protein OF83DRAFT_1296311 [Amylostereum chailletii]
MVSHNPQDPFFPFALYEPENQDPRSQVGTSRGPAVFCFFRGSDAQKELGLANFVNLNDTHPSHENRARVQRTAQADFPRLSTSSEGQLILDGNCLLVLDNVRPTTLYTLTLVRKVTRTSHWDCGAHEYPSIQKLKNKHTDDWQEFVLPIDTGSRHSWKERPGSLTRSIKTLNPPPGWDKHSSPTREKREYLLKFYGGLARTYIRLPENLPTQVAIPASYGIANGPLEFEYNFVLAYAATSNLVQTFSTYDGNLGLGIRQYIAQFGKSTPDGLRHFLTVLQEKTSINTTSFYVRLLPLSLENSSRNGLNSLVGASATLLPKDAIRKMRAILGMQEEQDTPLVVDPNISWEGVQVVFEFMTTEGMRERNFLRTAIVFFGDSEDRMQLPFVQIAGQFEPEEFRLLAQPNASHGTRAAMVGPYPTSGSSQPQAGPSNTKHRHRSSSCATHRTDSYQAAEVRPGPQNAMTTPAIFTPQRGRSQSQRPPEQKKKPLLRRVNAVLGLRPSAPDSQQPDLPSQGEGEVMRDIASYHPNPPSGSRGHAPNNPAVSTGHPRHGHHATGSVSSQASHLQINPSSSSLSHTLNNPALSELIRKRKAAMASNQTNAAPPPASRRSSLEYSQQGSPNISDQQSAAEQNVHQAAQATLEFPPGTAGGSTANHPPPWKPYSIPSPIIRPPPPQHGANLSQGVQPESSTGSAATQAQAPPTNTPPFSYSPSQPLQRSESLSYNQNVLPSYHDSASRGGPAPQASTRERSGHPSGGRTRESTGASGSRPSRGHGKRPHREPSRDRYGG